MSLICCNWYWIVSLKSSFSIQYVTSSCSWILLTFFNGSAISHAPMRFCLRWCSKGIALGDLTVQLQILTVKRQLRAVIFLIQCCLHAVSCAVFSINSARQVPYVMIPSSSWTPNLLEFTLKLSWKSSTVFFEIRSKKAQPILYASSFCCHAFEQ